MGGRQGDMGRRGLWKPPGVPEQGLSPSLPPSHHPGLRGAASTLSPPWKGLGHCVPQHGVEPSPACSLHSGFECITYPLLGPTSGSPEPRAAPESADTDSPLPKRDQEAALASDTLRGQGDTSSDLPGEWT